MSFVNSFEKVAEFDSADGAGGGEYQPKPESRDDYRAGLSHDTKDLPTSYSKKKKRKFKLPFIEGYDKESRL